METIKNTTMENSEMELFEVNQRPITADEFHAMGEAGILHEYERLELIDGRLVVMEPIGWPHANCVNRLVKLLAGRGPFDVSPQNPLRLTNYTEPQPDLVLLREDRDPDGAILGPLALVVIEVSDTSIRYDRGIKLARYAQAGVPELWIVDLNKHCIHLYRNPTEGKYQEHAVLERGDTMALPGGGEMAVSDIFPRV